MPRAPAAPVAASLQCGLPPEHQQAFKQELGGWFLALKWLVKEFRLHVGYETPDEEAGVRFWIDRYKRRRGPLSAGDSLTDSLDLSWPTADEPSTPATESEVAQARRWDQRVVERQLEHLFRLRAELCPDTPVLVPLQCKRASQNASVAPAVAARNKEVTPPSATPIELKRPSSRVLPAREGVATRRQGRSRPFAQEVQDRLFPSFAAGGSVLPLTDEQFVSRVVDLAIEFDGDAARAARSAERWLATGSLLDEDVVVERNWKEGWSQLEALELVRFWVLLPDKAALGLMVPAERAERLLEERVRGTTFAPGVFQVFWSRFRYDCLDPGVLYKFWLSLPKVVRSAHHVRGTPDHEAFELLRLEVRARAERRRAAQASAAALGAATPSASNSATGSKPGWRPNGEASAPGAALPLADPATTVVGRASSVEILARPKFRAGALPYLKALMRRFPRDLALQRMVRQCLGSGIWRVWHGSAPAPTSMNDVTTVLRYLSRAFATTSDALAPLADLDTAATLDPVVKDIAEPTGVPLEQALRKLQDAKEVTKAIDARIRGTAAQYVRRGARVGSFGPFFTTPQRDGADLRGILMVEDVFASLCQEFGIAEVLERFGPASYLPADFRGARARGLKGLLSAARGRGGAVTYCALQQPGPRCEVMRPPSSPQPPPGSSEVDGDPGGAWRPRPADAGFLCAWSADLGALRSCVGVVLDWSRPQRRRVEYNGGLQLFSDMRLRGGLGAPVEVVGVSPGGAAAAKGIAAGDVLHLEAGSREEDAFLRLPIVDALAYLGGPLELDFDRPSRNPLPAFPARDRPAVKVRIYASKDTHGEDPKPVFEQGAEWVTDSVAAGEPCHVPAVFVGRWVRVEFQTWPQIGGEALHLTIHVVKVWRLAPPVFQRRFVDAMRQRAEKQWRAEAGVLEDGCPYGMKSGCPCAIAANTDDLICPHYSPKPVIGRRLRGKPPTPGGLRGFWVSSARKGTFNALVKKDLRFYDRWHHDGEPTEKEELEREIEVCQNVGVNSNRKLALLQAKKRAWRRMVFDREEDARECTFHPRAAANVPPMVMCPPLPQMNDRGFFQRYDQLTTVDDFVKRINLGDDDNKNAGPYNNYQLNFRRKKLNLVRREFAQGSLAGSLAKLKGAFGLSSMRDRFVCHQPGCGKALEQSPDAEGNPFCGRCLGYLCPQHIDLDLHDCAGIKVKMVEKKLKRKEENEDEEVFDAKDKPTWGLLLEVHELAEQIRAAMLAKRRHRRSLELLNQSLAQFGALRLLERPFRCRMCPAVVARRRSPSKERGGRGAVRFGGPPPGLCCDCEKAHHPTELRFPAGESVARRTRWLQQSVAMAKNHSNARPGSAAARSATRKANDDREKPQADATKRRAQRRAAAGRRAASAEARRSRVSGALSFSESWASRPSQSALEMVEAAKAHVRAGKLEAARQSLADAHESAVAAAWEAPPWRTGAADEPDAEASTAASRDLVAQIQALAAKAPSRPLRDCEAVALRQRGAAAAREARGTLAACAELQQEVARLEQEDLKQSFQVFHPGAEERAEEPQPAHPSVPAGELDNDGKSQMCAEMLETGRCSRGAACPFGHQPADLSRRSRANLEELLRLSAQRGERGLLGVP